MAKTDSAPAEVARRVSLVRAVRSRVLSAQAALTASSQNVIVVRRKPGMLRRPCGVPLMPSPPRRAFNLKDAFFLIAATAVGLALWRSRYPFSVCDYAKAWPRAILAIWNSESRLSSASGFYRIYFLLAIGVWPFCLPWTLTILALRLRRPRPEWRRVARQPGTVACCSMAVACVMTAIPAFCVLHISGRTYESGWSDLGSTLLLVSPFCGSAIIGAWTTLLLSSSWRPDNSWIDRAGRILAVYWIGTIAVRLWDPH
jgi:hypothetical protein